MRFLKGEYWFAAQAAKRITGSPDLYGGQYRGYNSSINFLTCHDGFTLYDLYSPFKKLRSSSRYLPFHSAHRFHAGSSQKTGRNQENAWSQEAERRQVHEIFRFQFPGSLHFQAPHRFPASLCFLTPRVFLISSCILIMKNITRKTAGIILMVQMITGAGTVGTRENPTTLE